MWKNKFFVYLLVSAAASFDPFSEMCVTQAWWQLFLRLLARCWQNQAQFMCEQLYRTTDIKFCFNNISRNLRTKRFPATLWTLVTYSVLFKLWVIYTQVMSIIIFFSYYSNTMEVLLVVWSCLTEPMHVFLLMAATVFLNRLSVHVFFSFSIKNWRLSLRSLVLAAVCISVAVVWGVYRNEDR